MIPDGSGAEPNLASSNVRFVLVEPQSGGNVGAAARALKNLGFSRLILVRPACDPGGREARMFAVDARDVLAAAPVLDDLDAALEGAGAVVGTSRRRGRQRRPHYAIDELTPELAVHAARGEVAVLFGREDSGLPDADLDRCTHLAYLRASSSYPSFNLSQSVLLVAHELARAFRDGSGSDEESDEPLAEHGTREAMFAHLESALLTIGFVHDGSRVAILRRIRRLLGRAGMGSEDVRLLRGMARQVLWAAERAGLPLVPAAAESTPTDPGEPGGATDEACGGRDGAGGDGTD